MFKKGDYVLHFKGGLYRIEDIDGGVVKYRCTHTKKAWYRDQSEFKDKVSYGIFVGSDILIYHVDRFTKIKLNIIERLLSSKLVTLPAHYIDRDTEREALYKFDVTEIRESSVVGNKRFFRFINKPGEFPIYTEYNNVHGLTGNIRLMWI